MDTETMNKSYYKSFSVKPKEKKVKKHEINQAPVLGTSCYQAEFPNWNNGQKDVYHEKHP